MPGGFPGNAVLGRYPETQPALRLPLRGMTSARVEHAARNNAVWCEAVCRVHGAPGEFHGALWLNRHRVPRFYPNVVTLCTQDGTASQLARIQDLVATGPPGRWSVKDSFCVAGAIVHHTDDVVGLSNVFVPPEDPALFWAGCVAMAQERFPGAPIVAYEQEPELAIAREIGFGILQPLRIWTR